MRSIALKTLLFSIFLLVMRLTAQPVDSLSVMNDSLTTSSDTLNQTVQKERKKPIRLSPYFYNIKGELNDSLTNSPNSVYEFSDILKKNYSDASDILLNEANFQVYNFMEPFRPRYVAQLNLFPHQAGISLDHYNFTNPITGLSGTNYVPLEGIASIETSPLISSNGNERPLQINMRLEKNKEPYTRIMYRQGDFGFNEVDVAFSQQFTNRLLIQLGGTKQSYDGWRSNTSAINDHYRGQISYQISENIYNRFRFQKNDAKTGMFNYSAFPDYHNNDERIDIYNDITIVTDKENNAFWHIFAEVNTANKTSYFDSTKVNSQFDNYSIGLTRNLLFSGLRLNGGVIAAHSEIWGTGFSKEYPDNTVNAFLSAHYAINDNFSLIPSVTYKHIFNYKSALSASISVNWQKKNMKSGFSYEKSERLAFRNERSFHLWGFKGNENINTEKIHTATASFSCSLGDNLNVSALGGMRILKDEIIFEGNDFYNGENSSYTYFSAKINYKIYKFTFLGGGQISKGDIQISPQTSGWLQGQYHSQFLSGAIVFDAIGSVYANGSHHQIRYNPVVDRFYRNTNSFTDGYYMFNYKLAVTVKDVQFYFTMDNPLSTDYSYIYGYQESFRRICFGLNWVLWD